MSNLDPQLVFSSLRRLLTELIDGPSEKMSFILNPGDAGLLANVERLSAEQASAKPIPGRSSLAGHVGHLRYSLELLNRWSRGEENPFADADWPGSWHHQTVTEPEWRDLRDALAAEAHAWTGAVEQPREWDALTLTGAISSAAHLAYHLGSIRQVMGHLEAGG